MRKILLFLLAVFTLNTASAQESRLFELEIDPSYIMDQVVVAESPLKTQVLFIGGVDMVQTTETYGNAPTEVPAKEWHDFIGFTPDETGVSLGWVSVNHERIEQNDHIGDGGGMTTFRIGRDSITDEIIVLNQTLEDGRSGKFFNVDFVNTTGETGMNCGGIVGPTGQIWTAEEWFRRSNTTIADRDTSDFIIGVGTVGGNSSPAGFEGFNGQQIEKYQNYNYMTEIDPKQAKAIRKQYNWGRQGFEGGAVTLDNKTVYLGVDATPAFFSKFVADVPGDFTKGKTYVYKHDHPEKWLEIDNTDLDKMLNYQDEAIALGATMYNRIEWVTLNPTTGNVYFTETGRDYPGGNWAGEYEEGAVFAPHHIERASLMGLENPTNEGYWDFYGRVMCFDAETEEIRVLLEGGPAYVGDEWVVTDIDYNTDPDGVIVADTTYGWNDLTPSISNYAGGTQKALSNPDGLSTMVINGKSFLLVQEDLNGTSHGRVPAGIDTRTCELYMLDLDIKAPSLTDLIRITVVPRGAEVTGAIGTPDGKTMLVNAQHPSSGNPFPYNHSLTYAITGFHDFVDMAVNIDEDAVDGEAFKIYPNPATRTLMLNQVTDVAIYNQAGERMKVFRDVKEVDISSLPAGIYFVRNADGESKKLVIE